MIGHLLPSDGWRASSSNILGGGTVEFERSGESFAETVRLTRSGAGFHCALYVAPPGSSWSDLRGSGSGDTPEGALADCVANMHAFAGAALARWPA